jgi:hypothetical protein
MSLASPDLHSHVPAANTDTPCQDPDLGYSLSERWTMSGETFPARLLNSALRLAIRRVSLDSDLEACDKFYERQPQTVHERAVKVSAALNPNLLNLKFWQSTADIESSVRNKLKDYLEN